MKDDWNDSTALNAQLNKAEWDALSPEEQKSWLEGYEVGHGLGFIAGGDSMKDCLEPSLKRTISGWLAEFESDVSAREIESEHIEDLVKRIMSGIW